MNVSPEKVQLFMVCMCFLWPILKPSNMMGPKSRVPEILIRVDFRFQRKSYLV